jgi:hypothetical protein
VWNPADKDSSISLSGGNLVATKTTTGAGVGCVRGDIGMKAGQAYWETTHNYTGSATFTVGVATASFPLTNFPGVFLGAAAAAIRQDGNVYQNGSLIGNAGAISNGSIVRHWYDRDSGKYSIAVDGGDWFSAQIQLQQVPQYAIVGMSRPVGATVSCTANFGESPFVYPIPEGANGGVASFPAPVVNPVYCASEKFNTGSADTPANTIYRARIVGSQQDVETDREASCWVWDEQPQSSPGQVVLVNMDGGLDEWLAWEWRDADYTLFEGYEGDARAAFTVWSEGKIDHLQSLSNRRLAVVLASPLVIMQRSIQTLFFPNDQANAQLAGQPLPITLGRPLFCQGALLSNATTARNWQMTDGFTSGSIFTSDTVTGELTQIDDVYDSGDRFFSAADPYTAHNPMTLLNGGAFTTWAGSPAVPSGWTAITTFGATNDRFSNASGACRCQSSGQMLTAMFFNGSHLNASYRYTIAFTVTAVATAGNILFRTTGLPGQPPNDVVVAIAATGAVNVTIDVPAESVLQIVLGSYGAVDCTIDSMTVSSVQIIDWSYYTVSGKKLGFHLENAAAGKIVANPVGPKLGSTVIEYLPEVLPYVFARSWDAYGGDAPAWDIDGDAIAALDAKAHYRVATYITQSTSGATLLRDIMDSWCGWALPKRDGSITVGRIEEPSDSPVLELDLTNVTGEVLFSLDEAKGLTRRLAGRRNHSPYSRDDLAKSVGDPTSPSYDPALVAELTSEYGCIRQGAALLVPGDNAPVSASYAHALNAPAQSTLLQEPDDIQAEINRVDTMWRTQRCFYELTALLTATQADALEPGQTVRLTWPRIRGLEGGINLLVKRVRSRFFSRRVDLKLWGKAPQP